MASLQDDSMDLLPQEQLRDLQERTAQLHRELQAGQITIDLGRFLPPPGTAHRLAVLCELIKAQLEARYRHQKGCKLEEYFRLYPELGKPETLSAGLIFEEYRARTRYGDGPALDEYRDRFPQQFEKLQRMVQGGSDRTASRGTIGRMPRPTQPMAEEGVDTDIPTGSSPRLPPVLPPLSPTPSAPAAPPAAAPPQAAGLRAAASQNFRSVLSQSLAAQGYELLESISRDGSQGEVYRARAPGGVIVAVKHMFRSVEDELSQRELKALDRLKELSHPYLLSTHNFQIVDGRLTIVMELADGSLHQRFAECKGQGLPGIPVAELLEYFKEAAEALDYLSREKLSHRDVKPQNLLHLKGHAKVADFGITREQANVLEQTMNPSGTPPYMAPETWLGNISVHSDQYSFAITWYEMRVGRRPFAGKNLLDLTRQHASEPPDLSAVSPAEQKVLRRALAKKPEERFASCGQFVQALRDAVAPPPPPPPAQGLSPRVAFILLALTTLLATIAIAAVVYFRQTPPVVDPEPPSWQPAGWEPEPESKIVKDVNERRYYDRLTRDFGGQKVVIVLVPKKNATRDDPSFYIMENKVWNDLYAVFWESPKRQDLFKFYGDSGDRLVDLEPEWKKGGWAALINKDGPEEEPFLGVTGERGLFPVFRVKVTEAHCFAEWLGGKLPTRKQWMHAAGYGDDKRDGPYNPDATPDKLAVGLGDGPGPVNLYEGHVSIFGCRQMAGNGFEWTRDIDDGKEMPLKPLNVFPKVYYVGRSYCMGPTPLTFEQMPTEKRLLDCCESKYDIGFRVVLEE